MPASPRRQPHASRLQAWQLLTEVYRIPAERLYVTYFEGNEALGVPADTEARDIWLKVGVPLRPAPAEHGG